MRAFFWNSDEDRLRSFWRVLLQAGLTVVPLLIAAQLGLYKSGESIAIRVVVLALPLTIASIYLVGRYVDKRRLSDFGLQFKQKSWWLDYGFGWLAGFVAATSVVLFLRMIGWATIGFSSVRGVDLAAMAAGIVISLLVYAGVGVFEELMRAYQIRNFTEGLAGPKFGVAAAMFLAVLLAGLWSVSMHLASGDAAFLFYVLITSCIYGLFFLWTGRAALAMAMHFSWDFTVSSIFFLGAEGIPEAAIAYVYLDRVPDLAINPVPAIGILAKLLGLLLVAGWIKRRAGDIRLQRQIAVPSLVDLDRSEEPPNQQTWTGPAEPASKEMRP
ncbi:MAG: type II CAAX endopeptidase family protein [Anaerolineales bacterium]|nr:type II CAAX endopeptidase family protein [Anaerolineales bacterium]